MVIDFVLVASTAIWRRPLAAWIFGDSMQHRETENILLLAMVAVGIQQIDGVTGAALRGLEQFRRQAIIELSMRGALAAFVTLVAWRTGSVLAVLAAQCLAYFLFTVLRLLALRKILPGRLLLARSSRQHVLLLFRYGSWMWLSAIAGVTYSSGDRIVIGRVLGSTAAGEYSIYVQLTQMVHFIPSSIFAFSLPAFSRLGASGRNHAEIRYSYRAYSVGINASALGIALALITCWHHVLKVFVSNDLLSAAPPLVVWILTANFLFLAVTAIAYYLLLALGKSRLVSLVTSSWMCVSLLLMVVLIPRYGLAGAAAARFVYALGTAQLLAKAHRFLRLV
jgi:O-antigen/teichoic acid export membrane protein